MVLAEGQAEGAGGAAAATRRAEYPSRAAKSISSICGVMVVAFMKKKNGDS